MQIRQRPRTRRGANLSPKFQISPLPAQKNRQIGSEVGVTVGHVRTVEGQRLFEQVGVAKALE